MDEDKERRTFFSSCSTAPISTPSSFRDASWAEEAVLEEMVVVTGQERARTSTSTRSSSTCSGVPTAPIVGFAPSSGRNWPVQVVRIVCVAFVSITSKQARVNGELGEQRCARRLHNAPVPGETKAQPPYAPMRPTLFGKRAKRCWRTDWVDGRGVKKTSLYFCMLIVIIM